MESTRKHWTAHPRESASIFSLLFFTWVTKIFWTDYKKRITEENIWGPFGEHKSNLLGDRLEKQWKKQVEKKNKKPSLLLALIFTFWKEFFFLGIIQLASQLIDVLLRPRLLGLLISYFNVVGGADLNTALYAGGGLLTTALITSLCSNHYLMNAFTIGMKMRAACVSLVYRKSLVISKAALGKVSAGQVVNLVSNDVSRFDMVAITFHFLWCSPLTAIIISYFLYEEVGYAGFAGMAIVFTVAPLQTYTAKLTTQFRRKIASKADERIRITDEVLGGIHVIKMFAWEKAFYNLLEWARDAEMKFVKYANFLRGAFMTFNLFTTRMAVFCTLVTYALSGQTLNAGKVFVIAAYFGMMSATMCSIFVRGVAEVAEGYVSIKRLEKYMLNDEIDPQENVKKEKNGKNGIVNDGFVDDSDDGFDKKCCVLKNVYANWVEDTEPILKNINLTVPNGKLVGVIGGVGSGKSSLLQLLLGEMKVKQGELHVNGKLSYTAQESWLFGGTVMQNILLGLPYDKDRYEKVIRACSLTRDMELFSNGDQTEVGERGASLSGGQKARINLARAVYKEADIYILDDPLSAVDAHVAKRLFRDCFQGFLKNKIVILATHQLQFIQDCDYVILLNEGRIQDQGTFSEFLKHGNEFGGNILSQINAQTEAIEPIERKRRFSRMISIRSIRSVSTVADDISTVEGPEEDVVVEEEAPIIEDTLKKQTNLEYKGSVALGYIRAAPCGQVLFVMFVLLVLASQFFASSCDLFVSYWTTQEELIVASKNNVTVSDDIGVERTLNVSLYGALVLSLFLCALARGFVFYVMCFRCSKGLHSRMTKAILSTDLGYFNKNPSGAILNRFSRDLGSTDELLPKSILDSAQVFGQVIGAIVTSMIVNFWFAIPAGVFTTVTVTVRHYFMKTSLRLKRIENIVRGPVFTHLNSSLQGLSTIRAHGSQHFLIKQFDLHQDLHTTSLYTYAAAQQAYGYFLDLLGMFYLSIVLFTFLIFSRGVYGADVGLAITQSLVITALLNWGMRGSSEVANLMTSVERMLSLTLLTEEEKDLDKKTFPIVQWPSEGDIKCYDLKLKYEPDEAPVLEIDYIHIKAGEKVGIVGRTGAGKSSFTSALFRLAHVEGRIVIDGIDTSTIPFNFLRSKICIIPQNPILFSGNLRKNLDPFNQYPDYILWKALSEVDLTEVLKDGFGLDTKIAEGGSNLSVGQRQLVCLARAVVKNSKIIILDEATASVDPKTDDVIQKTIRKKFDTCTVLAVAHRLNTVIDSDKIIVMDAGKVVEFDSPLKLLENREGYFFRLVQETGSAMASQLVYQAQQAYLTRSQEGLQE